jgi:hypothetical protein
MAPEQHSGQGADERSDQYAFCFSLWEGLTQTRPFQGRDAREIAVLKAQEKLRPWAAGAEVPAGLRTVLARGLRADPALRWPSMAALLTALKDEAEGAGVRLDRSVDRDVFRPVVVDRRRVWSRRLMLAIALVGAASLGASTGAARRSSTTEMRTGLPTVSPASRLAVPAVATLSLPTLDSPLETKSTKAPRSRKRKHRRRSRKRPRRPRKVPKTTPQAGPDPDGFLPQ